METETSAAVDDTVGSSTELHASVAIVSSPGQCGDSLCREAVWNPPHASPLAFATGHWWA